MCARQSGRFDLWRSLRALKAHLEHYRCYVWQNWDTESAQLPNGTECGTQNHSFYQLLQLSADVSQLIWSAAAASNSSTVTNQPVTIYCKDETGSIVPWPHSQDAIFRPWFNVHYNDGESPLSRIAELFNVNHFIVSQPRPYLIPFLSTELDLLDRRQAGKWNITRSLMRLVTAEIRHRLRQLDYLGLLPQIAGRLLIEETIPGPNLTLVPDLSLSDFAQLLQRSSKESLANWLLKGEKGVWPAVSALKVRCAIEIALDKGYQIVRRRGPRETSPVASMSGPRRRPNEGTVRRRRKSDFGFGRSTSTLV